MVLTSQTWQHYYTDKVNSVTSSSTDMEIPTAKAVWAIVNAKYTKPSNGIPNSDLSTGVNKLLLPSYGSSDNGKFLRMVDGEPAWQIVQSAENTVFGGV